MAFPREDTAVADDDTEEVDALDVTSEFDALEVHDN